MSARRPSRQSVLTSGRLRLLAATSVLMLSLGVVCAGASAKTSGRISAHLSSTAFTAAQAATVKVVYKFSFKSGRFAYVLSRKQGTAWLTVRSVNKRGSFHGSHTIAVSGLFGPKPVQVGQYRVKLSSSANTVTLSFAVVPPPATAPPPAVTPQAGKPKAGSWVATNLSGPLSGSGGQTNAGDSVTVTMVAFTVAPDQATVTGFGFAYNYSGPGSTPGSRCSGSGSTADQPTSPITNGQFSTPAENTWSDP
jgi:hypothetical protein